MDVYVARQPIFDKKMNVMGYELLYRKSMNNYYEGTDDTTSTAEIISNAFLTMELNELTNGTRAFINFSKDMISKKTPTLLPKDGIVVEILERLEVSESLIESCKELREEGYIIALDDFVFNDSYLPLLDIAHIVKVEFSIIELKEQINLIKKYKNKIKFLAEKIETREEYEIAIKIGYDYFQGYFFSKPVIVKGKDIGSLNANLVRIIDELNKAEPDYQKMVDIIETDIDLSYKMLKVANTVFYEAKHEIRSLKLALVRFGFKKIEEWIYIMMVKGIQNIENKELIKNCLIRAKSMELLSIEIGKVNRKLDYFITGLFSCIDILLGRNMEEILEELPLSEDVREALLGEENEIKKSLNLVINLEKANWDIVDLEITNFKIQREKHMDIYFKSLKWAININF